ncbi:MAG: farnesyl-diphosphate farnesyltransferase [Euryarchaeota archaeon]|nr:farnesyl-diphosphate farnesyltransferase [Euryarchaeota archaeon]
MLIDSSADTLLEDTSRSFFLTLKVLPRPIRKQVGLLYLLARVADTIADSKTGQVDILLDSLASWDIATSQENGEMSDLSFLANLQSNPAEERLLKNVDVALSAFQKISKNDQIHMRRCLKIIIGGQTLDLQRFGPANDSDEISALENDQELDDYAYRVAGSVGEFWTSMTLAHCISANGPDSEKMFELGIRFGKALQMINILRDIPEDLSFGRCYIPLNRLKEVGLDPIELREISNHDTFSPIYQSLLDITQGHLDAAEEYILMLPRTQIRLKIACLLPVLIGQKTVNLLRTSKILDSTKRVKVPRKIVKRLMIRSIFSVITPGGTKRLLRKNKAKKSNFGNR